ncbi:MAG: glucose-1-phosphate cytidylyltransferase [Elusimicrobia bacterium]|nr:glucose-1-phosphate cytidylyltransferase [Elusimicrobiota bacterium]MBD3412263.1 glucose-1-phosphate cytidylyltransferase [Elusimicrobiota bacterium]
MKTVILCGGLGTRLSEETSEKPKPMVEIGGLPILWHIMNIYGAYGFNNFFLAVGYKGAMIKQYFLNYYNMQSDLTITLKTGQVKAKKKCFRDWTVNIVDTGMQTMTGGRLLRLKEYLKHDTFMLTYGDGVANINIKKLLAFHKKHKKIATVTAVRPVARFGMIKTKGDAVVSFQEKLQHGKGQIAEGWINGGFFVFEPAIFDYLKGDSSVLEREPLAACARDGEMVAYKNEDYWGCMDTLREKRALEALWQNNEAPWKVWQ